MRLPEALRAVLEKLKPAGRPLLVGGCVRDWLLGRETDDFDVEVYGTDYEMLARVLAPFGATDLVGRSFGVIKLRLEKNTCDFSLPRRESKTGSGHRGFAVEPTPGITEAEASARRDFTINSIAWDPFTGAIIDPHGGERDLKARLLRHTSAAFTEDPLRVLRGFQFAARFELTLAPETAALCRSILDSYRELPVERVWGEWEKWAVKSVAPARGILVLEQTGWISHFPELAALHGVPQEPEWHPEGDVLAHTKLCLEALMRQPDWQTAQDARRRCLSLAVLTHDFGKPATTVHADRRGKMRWISPVHEAAGGPIAETFLRRIGAPLELIERVRPLVVNHLAHHHGQGDFTDTSVRRLARKLAPATIDELCTVMLADHHGRPPLLSPEVLARIERLRERSHSLEVSSHAPRPLILGRHLVARKLPPGPVFKAILDACFEAQLDGAFADEAGGLVFLENYLRLHPPGG